MTFWRRSGTRCSTPATFEGSEYPGEADIALDQLTRPTSFQPRREAEGFVLQPGQECRVYTNEVHPESCGFSFQDTGSALWPNNGECGHLYPDVGIEVST